MDRIKSGVDRMRTWRIITGIVAIRALLGTLPGMVARFIDHRGIGVSAPDPDSAFRAMRITRVAPSLAEPAALLLRPVATQTDGIVSEAGRADHHIPH